jgi:alkanesulfonate monooxygenase SsuD/methylene tetrahydromethanopterin reductase-like flavin-dependent oxidoreductase (luciferase family)
MPPTANEGCVKVLGDDSRIRFGIHSGQQYATADDFLELAQGAEELGFDWFSAFDHFRPPDAGDTGPCLEGTTLVAAAAARTSRIRVALLVLGVIYRNPGIVASIAATIDHVAHGRLELGLGATWHDGAQEQYGIGLPPLRARLEMLDETCRILRALWTHESTTFAGRHFRMTDARLEPKPVQAQLPLVIGGAGERRLLRAVAEHADVWNSVPGDTDAYARKLGVLADHCAAVGRDSATIRKSILYRTVLADDERAARARLDELFPAGSPARASTFCGTPEQCTEHLRRFADLGVRDFLLNVRPPIDWTTMELVARHVAPAFGAGGVPVNAR